MWLKREATVLTAMVAAWVYAAGPARGVDPGPPPQRPSAPVALEVELGWGGVYRPGEWTPVYVRMPTADRPGAGMLEVRAYQDSRSTVSLEAGVALSPSPRGSAAREAGDAPGAGEWRVVPMPAGSLSTGMGVSVRDADGRLLGVRTVSTLPEARVTAITSNTRLVAVSGGPGAPTSTPPGDYVSAFVPLTRLPETPELYESLDGLVLTHATLAELSEGQAAAVSAWVRAGGLLVVCVGPEGLQAGSPLGRALPVVVGEMTVYRSGGAEVTGRRLRALAGATEVPLGDGMTGVSAGMGLGRVTVSPVPLSADTRRALGVLIGEMRPRVSLDSPGVPDADGSAPWRGAGWVLLALGLLAGPVQAVVRRAHDVWPWSSPVVAGCVMAAVGAGLLVLAAPASQKPKVTEGRLVDQWRTEKVAEASLSAGAVQAGEGLPRVLLPLRQPGVSHSAVRTTIAEGGVKLVSGPDWSATVNSRVRTVPAEVAVRHLTPDRTVVNVDANPEQVYLESAGGVIPGRNLGGLDWSFQGPAVQRTLPPEILAAARLAPRRSVMIQQRVASGEVSVVWSKHGSTWVRTVMPER